MSAGPEVFQIAPSKWLVLAEVDTTMRRCVVACEAEADALCAAWKAGDFSRPGLITERKSAVATAGRGQHER